MSDGVSKVSVRLWICVVGLCFYSASASVFAEGLADDTLTIGVIHIPPYVDLKATPGTPKGRAVNSTLAVAARCGLHVNFVQVPAWSRALVMAKVGRVDAITPTLKTAEREMYLDYPITPIFRLKIALFANKKTAATETTDDLSIMDGKTVGRLMGIATEQRIDAYLNDGKATLVRHMSFRSLLENLTRHRLDYVVGDREMVEHAIEDLGAEGIVRRMTPDLGEVVGYLALSKVRKVSAEIEAKIQTCLIK